MRLGSKIQAFGWAWLVFGSVTVSSVLGSFFDSMKMNEKPGMLAFSLSMYTGFLIIMLGFRANRVLDDGKKHSLPDILRVFKRFSLPQILLAIGGLLFCGGSVLPLSFDASGWLLIGIIALDGVAVILAVVRAIKGLVSGPVPRDIVTERKRPPQPVCYRCGTAVSQDGQTLQGRRYCAVCAEGILTKQAQKGQCCMCEQAFGLETLLYADGRFYCRKCFDRMVAEVSMS